jgi:PIN domain nuclease of toxin-antitoxin system
MTSEVVLDASAVLADIYGEAGSEVVRQTAAHARLSAVNLAEVVTKLIDDGMPPDEADDLARRLRWAIEPVDADRALLCGLLYEKTRRTGVSLGDRFCLVLGQELGAPVLTADRRWATLDLDVEVRLIR